MINQVPNKQVEQIETGEIDVIANLQAPTAPELRIGMRVDVLCNYVYNVDESEVLMWSQGLIQQISDGTKIEKNGGGTHKKGGVLVLWDANVEQNESASTPVVSLSKNLQNKQVDGS